MDKESYRICTLNTHFVKLKKYILYKRNLCAHEFFIVPSVCGKTTQAVSDQAWNMMKVYDARDLDEEMLDHDMLRRHACNIF